LIKEIILPIHFFVIVTILSFNDAFRIRGHPVIVLHASLILTLQMHPELMSPRIFDCFLYHNEAYMLYLHLLTLAPVVNHFVIGHSNQSFTKRIISSISFHPFAQEIEGFSNQIVFLYINFDRLLLNRSRCRAALPWRREATARNYLIEGVKGSSPCPDDLILLCDVDEITTRAAIKLIRRKPPSHYYNLHGIIYHYSFRWRVGQWNRPLIVRFGSIRAPLDDYKFMPILCSLSGYSTTTVAFVFQISARY
jgi:hypothetical protein